MQKIIPLLLAVLLTSCNSGPATSDTETTTKTTTTSTTTPAAPIVPPVPPPTILTQSNLDRVLNGMSSADVETILGPPSSSQSQPIPIVGGTQTTFTYLSNTSSVTILFKNDQVQEKSGSFNP